MLKTGDMDHVNTDARHASIFKHGHSPATSVTEDIL